MVKYTTTTKKKVKLVTELFQRYSLSYKNTTYVPHNLLSFIKWDVHLPTIHYHLKGTWDIGQPIDSGQTAHIYKLAWLYTGGKDYSLSAG